MKLQRVINFSGGKTSAFMAIKYYVPGDLVIFCDTGREHPKTYKFINDFEAFENIPVTRINYPGYFSKMIIDKGYGMVPNRVTRFCTKELKVLTNRKYLVSIGINEIENLIGFRYDEPQRVLRNKSRWVKWHNKFPLFEDRISKDYIEDFWRNKEYTLEIPRILGNCDLCFMKGKNAILAILRDYPGLADKWIEDEEMTGGTYFNGISFSKLKEIAQNNLFKGYDLGEINPAYNCACTS